MEKTITDFNFLLFIFQVVNIIFWIIVVYFLYKILNKK